MPDLAIHRRREISFDEPGDVPSAAAGRGRASSSDLSLALARLDRAVDVLAVAAVRQASLRPAANDDVLYVGFNGASASKEIEALKKSGSVRALDGEVLPSGVVIGGTSYDFTDPAQVHAFVQTLRLDPRVELAVEDALHGAAPYSRGKLAQIAAVFAEAERGTPIPARLVISGHSGGLDVYGDRGDLRLVDLARLARAMPRAGACIEDLHFSACSTAGQIALDDERGQWRAAFPNVKTMWAYAGSSPLAPVRHLEAWGRATKGSHDTIAIPSDIERERVVVWTAKDGYRDPTPLARLRVAEREADRRFGRFISGTLTAGSGGLADPQSALVDYQTYRVLSQRNELPASERATLARKADQILRIRYYEEGVRTEFQRRYGAAVKDGFDALGLAPPSFAALTRVDALAQIARFESMLAKVHPAPSAALSIAPALRGLRDLDRDVIPETDCHH